MSYTDRIVKAMQYGHIYDQATLAGIVKIPERECGQALHLLSQSGFIECLQHDRYRKNRKYTTRQRQIF